MTTVGGFARLRVCAFNAPTRQRANAPTAFSLVELVISMAILSVGMVGAMRVFPIGLRASQRAELNSRAALVAQRVIESLKLEPWDALAEGQTTSEEEGFSVTTRISQPEPEDLVDPGRLKAIEVIVQFTPPFRERAGFTQAGQERRLVFITYARGEVS